MSDWVTVAKVGELQPGQQKTVDGRRAQAVLINLAGRHYAIEPV